MTTLAFDTLKAAKALREAGFEEAQAEAVVSTVGEAIDGNVSTKADIAALKADVVELKADVVALNVSTKADIAELKADVVALKTGMAELKADLYRLVLMTAIAVIGSTVALVKLIP